MVWQYSKISHKSPEIIQLTLSSSIYVSKVIPYYESSSSQFKRFFHQNDNV